MTIATPWLLSSRTKRAILGRQDQEFLGHYLIQRGTAMVQQEPHLAERAQHWLTVRRKQQSREGRFVRVDHVDLLTLSSV